MASDTKTLQSRHPLQRLPSPSRSTSLIIHILGIVAFSLSFKYLNDFPSFINRSWGWHWQYLTILGLAVACLTFVIGLLADITLSPTLFSFKNSLLLCSAPLEVLISLLYWSISFIDKSLLIPPGVALSSNADIGFHLLPALFLTIDLLLLSPPWTIRAAPAMVLSTMLAVGYWVWIDACYNHNGFYPYPLFEKLDITQRATLFGGAALLMAASTLTLQWVYARLNGLQGSQHKSTPRNIKGE